MQRTSLRERDEPRVATRRDLRLVAFDLELISANPGGFVPVNLSSANHPVAQSYPSNSFAFPPASATVASNQSSELSNRRPNRNRLNFENSTKDFEIHVRTKPLVVAHQNDAAAVGENSHRAPRPPPSQTRKRIRFHIDNDRFTVSSIVFHYERCGQTGIAI